MIEAAFDEGLALARQSHALARGTTPHQLMHATWPVLAALYHLGRWDEMAEIVAEHIAAYAEEPAAECQFARDGPVIGATVLAHRGDLAGARELATIVGDPATDVQTASAWQAWFAI
jgi:hypothetical protein